MCQVWCSSIQGIHTAAASTVSDKNSPVPIIDQNKQADSNKHRHIYHN